MDVILWTDWCRYEGEALSLSVTVRADAWLIIITGDNRGEAYPHFLSRCGMMWYVRLRFV